MRADIFFLMFSRITLWVVSFAGVNIFIYLFVADELVRDDAV